MVNYNFIKGKEQFAIQFAKNFDKKYFMKITKMARRNIEKQRLGLLNKSRTFFISYIRKISNFPY